MKKKNKFCTFCGLSLLSCSCGEKTVDKMKGVEKPESKYPVVNLMGALQGAVTGSTPPTEEEFEERAKRFTPVEGLDEDVDGQSLVSDAPRDLASEGDFNRPIPPAPIDSMTNINMNQPVFDPDVVLGEIHPRLLSMALLGKDVIGKDKKKAEVVRKEIAELRRIEDEKARARDKHRQEWAEICRAGMTVAQAIHGVPQDGAHPVVVENKVEALFDYMSVETATDDVPYEIRFAVPKEEFKEGINRVSSDFDVHRFVHFDSMPPELQEVIKSYLAVVRSSSGHSADLNMEVFKESAIALAASLIAVKKKAV